MPNGSVFAFSTTSLNYSWRFNLTNVLAGAASISLTLTNIQSSNEGAYYAVVTNFSGSVTTLVATLTVILRDSDHNGLPDDWELAYFGHIGVDPNADPDGDGMSNLNEYIAGTDPTNALSVLKVQLLDGGAGGARVRFLAMPKIGYTLQYRTNLTLGQWGNLTNVAARPASNTVEIFDPGAGAAGRRFYRIATPQQP